MEHIKIVCKIPPEIALQDGFLSKLIRKMERQVKNYQKEPSYDNRNHMGAAGSIRGYFKCTDYGFINGIIRKQDAKNEHRKNIDN